MKSVKGYVTAQGVLVNCIKRVEGDIDKLSRQLKVEQKQDIMFEEKYCKGKIDNIRKELHKLYAFLDYLRRYGKNERRNILLSGVDNYCQVERGKCNDNIPVDTGSSSKGNIHPF